MRGEAPIAGGRLVYEIEGEGPPVVFVHGFSLDLRMWDDQVAALRPTRQVVRYDLRGFGGSSLPDGSFSHFDDLAALLGHLRIDRADLVGLSFGGGVAIDLALAHPKLVRSVVLIDSILGGYSWPRSADATQRIWDAGRTEGIEAARALWMNSPLFAPALRHPYAGPRVRRMISEYSGWHWANTPRMRRLDPPAIGRLAEIQAPVLAIVGEMDDLDFHKVADLVVASAPRARKEIVPGAGHLPNLEARGRVDEILGRFFGELDV